MVVWYRRSIPTSVILASARAARREREARHRTSHAARRAGSERQQATCAIDKTQMLAPVPIAPTVSLVAGVMDERAVWIGVVYCFSLVFLFAFFQN
jgi:hypothetical protein